MTTPVKALIFSAGAALALGLPGAAVSQEITLRVAGRTPDTHYLITEGIKYWMDLVTEKSGGRVAFDYYPAGQLGNDILQLVQSGAADLGEVPLAYVAEAMPMTGGAAGLPGLFADACHGSRALTAALVPDSTLIQTEWVPAGVRPAMTIATGAYRIITAKPVQSVEDFAGMKTRSSGGSLEVTITMLGGVPVTMSTTDMYGSFTKGTLDAVALSMQSMRPFDLQTVARYFVDNVSLGLGGEAMIISDAAWAKLPDDIKAIMQEAQTEATQHYCDYALTAEATEKEKFVKEDGMTAVTIADDKLAAFTEKTAASVGKWVELHQAAGRPAEKVVEELRAAAASVAN